MKLLERLHYSTESAQRIKTETENWKELKLCREQELQRTRIQKEHGAGRLAAPADICTVAGTRPEHTTSQHQLHQMPLLLLSLE